MRTSSKCSIERKQSLGAFEPMHVMQSLSLHPEEGPSSGACLEYAMQHLYYETS